MEREHCDACSVESIADDIIGRKELVQEDHEVDREEIKRDSR